MAVARAQQRAGGGLTSAHIWMIVFVVLWLVSTVGFVILFTYQEDLANESAQLREESVRLIKPAERDSLRHYYDRAAGGSSVIGVVEKERQDTVQLITGSGQDDLAAALTKKDALVGRIREGGIVADVSANDPLLTTLTSVYDKLEETHRQLTETLAANEELNRSKEELAKTLDESRRKFDDAAATLTVTVETEEKQNQEFRTEKDEAVDSLQTQIAEMQDDQIRQLRRTEEAAVELRNKLGKVEKIMAAQQARLAENRPPVDPKRVAWQADGRIVRALPGDPYVYLNLGRADNLLLGLRFQVYSPTRGPGADGNGKATIKVVGLESNAAECRILRSTPGDPIVEGDLASNAIYDRTRKFSFVLSGGFDLDFNGTPERDGADRVQALVEKWGGRVADRLNETTDFLVVGERPHVPTLGPDPDPTLQERERTARAAATAFDTVRQDARALSIPILTQAQFLAFIGYSSGEALPLGE